MFVDLIEREQMNRWTPDAVKHATWKADAKAHGWEWLHQVTNHHSQYRHIACGHEQQVQRGHMQIGNVRCQGCTEQSWRADAIAQGWALLEKIDKDSGLYTHVCGHTQQVQMSAMRKGKVRCQQCWLKKLKDEAADKGWSWLHQTGATGHHSQYRHVVCGYEQQAEMGAMRNGRVRCHSCMEQNWRDEAQAQGWLWLHQTGTAGNHSQYRHTACGHSQQSRMCHMRIGNVTCHGCGESWATKPSNLYLLDITTACGQRFLKLGIAQIVARRAALYGLAEGTKIKVLYAKAYSTGAEACKVEKQLHKTATTIPCVKRFKGAKKLMDSGHTECYEYSEEAAGHLMLNLPWGTLRAE